MEIKARGSRRMVKALMMQKECEGHKWTLFFFLANVFIFINVAFISVGL
jgi:hypothetical protein